MGQLGGQKGQEGLTYFKPPLNETLSHSIGKVVFDHGPKSYGIGNNRFNPIYEGGDKITPDINPKCRLDALALS